MSKAELVITAVIREGRSQADVARDYNMSKGWVSKLVARYKREGEAAFKPRSRRPKTSPNKLDPDTIKLIAKLRQDLTNQGLDAGPDTITWPLQHHHKTRVSPATISRHLQAAGLVTPEPKKRPKTSYIRFEAGMPNETWQSDFTHYRLTTGQDTEIVSWLDDCTRYALRVTCHHRVTAPIVLNQFKNTYKTHQIPASTLTDNGMVYTVRFATGRGGRTAFEHELRRLHIQQKNSRPSHPTTCGKVERFQQTMKKWLRAQPNQPNTLEELQTLIDQFVDHYNNHRPHRSLPHQATPAARYNTLPRALPGPSRDPDTHDRIRHDRIDHTGVVTLRVNGKMHHIGIGRTHARTHIIMLIQDLNARIINATTGEILRHLTINPAIDYQPQNARKPPNP